MSGIKVAIILLLICTISVSSNEVNMDDACIMDGYCYSGIDHCNFDIECISEALEECDQNSDICEKQFKSCGDDEECHTIELHAEIEQNEEFVMYCLGLLKNAKYAGFNRVQMTGENLHAACRMEKSFGDLWIDVGDICDTYAEHGCFISNLIITK